MDSQNIRIRLRAYDHRVLDGKEAVTFLVRVKELLESPDQLLFGKDPLKALLEL